MYLSLSLQAADLSDERVEGVVHEVSQRRRRLEERTAQLCCQSLALLCSYLRK